MLTFDEKPSYEAQSTYKVVVVASDGSVDSYFKVAVNVKDVEEEGSVKLQPTDQEDATLLQPQVGVGITAHSLTDPDGVSSSDRATSTITTATYQWYRSSSKTATGTPISTGRRLTPTRRSLPTWANTFAWWRPTMTDGGATRWLRPSRNTRPLAQSTTNTAPEFSADSTTRVVVEGTDKGTSIGNPVTATDDNSGERLTYWLTGTDGAGTAARFSIDAMTGQLKVKTKLNYEGADGAADQCATANACAVTVNVADSSGDSTAAGTDTIDGDHQCHRRGREADVQCRTDK